MLNAKDQECFREVSAEIRSVYPDARIWAFGSRVHGEQSPDSDLDVCVVLPQLDWEAWMKISDIAWEVGFRHDRMVDTEVFSEDQFEHGPCSGSPLVKSIREEGMAA